MKHLSVRPLVAAISLALGAGAAFAEPTYKLSGFGTLAAVHSDLDTADFTGSVFHPNGAGKTRSTSTNPDSKAGVQVNALFNSQWSAVAQVISQYQYDASYWPQLEWGNVTYKPTDSLSLRIGRVALPAYLMSESRLVGYAHTWVRPPQEVYSILPLTSNDGIDASYRSSFGSVQNTVQAYYGTNKVKISGGGTAKAKSSWGVNDTVEVDSLTLRAAYTYLKEELEIPSMAPLFAGIAATPGMSGVYEKYDPKNLSTHAIALGASYDPGNWFVMSEFVDYKGDSILSDSRAWYVAGGYRLGKFTPYLIHAQVKTKVEEETAAGFFNGPLNTILYQVAATQKTSSIGVRYDVYKNTAIKLQYDHLETGSRSNGRLKPPTGSNVFGRDANIVTLGVDFVF
jgi:hypothetical protein